MKKTQFTKSLTIWRISEELNIQFAVEIIKHSVSTELIDVEALLKKWEIGANKVGIKEQLQVALQQWDYVPHEEYLNLYKDKQYQFIGGNGNCVCSHHIEHEFYIFHPITKTVAITGSECILKLGNAKQVSGAKQDKKSILKKQRQANKIKKEIQRENENRSQAEKLVRETEERQAREKALAEQKQQEEQKRREDFEIYEKGLFAKKCKNCNDTFRSEKPIENWKNMCPICYLNNKQRDDEEEQCWTWIKCDEYDCQKPIKSRFSKCYNCKNKSRF